MDKCYAKDIAIICDFDGTISVEDVNRAVSMHFGGEKTIPIMKRYRNSEIGLRESLKTQYEVMKLKEKDFQEFVINNMKIDNTFFDFYDFIISSGMELAIVSGGFINYIEILFNQCGKNLKDMGIKVFSNRLVVEDGVLKTEYGSVPQCNKSFGPCGICKFKYVSDYKKDYRVIYIGDGHTDRCAAESADLVFAKDSLIKYCEDNGIEYIGYTNFKDIKEYIMKNILLSDR